MFFCEFGEISKNQFFYRTPPVAASVNENVKVANASFKSTINLIQKRMSSDVKNNSNRKTKTISLINHLKHILHIGQMSLSLISSVYLVTVKVAYLTVTTMFKVKNKSYRLTC